MLRRIGVVGFATAAVVLLAGPAWAHVEVTPNSAPKGSDAVLAFTVPDESDTASTVKVQVFFPTDHPIAEALVEPIAGWTATVATMKLTKQIQTDNGPVSEGVKSVTWTGGHIVPGDFQQFKVSVGLPDDADSIEFKALQTYSDGSVVSWIQDTPAGGPEPDHPAPVLALTSGDETATTAPTGTATTTGGSGTTAPATGVAKKSDVDSAKTLSGIAIGIGAVALVLGLGAFLLGRRPRRA